MAVQKKPFISDKLAKRRKAVSRARRILTFFILTIILTGLGLLTYAHRFFIKEVEIFGTEVVSAEEVKINAENQISGLHIIIPKRNIFLYPQKKIVKKLAIDFPRLSTIKAEVQNKNLVVTVTEREPAYLWCGENIPATRLEAFANDCYFVDDTGFIFSLAPQFSESVYPKIYTKLINSDTENLIEINPIAKYAMSSEVLSNVSTFASKIATSALKPSAYSITEDGDAIIFLFRNSDILPEVRYNPKHDPITASSGFKTAISSEPLKSKLTTSFSTLEYIDVRFANKVFYKFGNENAKDNEIKNGN